MAEFDVRSWALKGAEQRLVEIGEEAKAIFRSFPELRGKGRGFEAAGADSTPGRTAKAPSRRRSRRKISAEGRKRISEAQKARWAKQKAQKPAGAASEVAATSSKARKGARKKK